MGRSAAASSAAIGAGSARLAPGGVQGGGASAHSMASTSSGRLSTTGPGTPWVAIAQARAMSPGTASGVRASPTHFAIVPNIAL